MMTRFGGRIRPARTTLVALAIVVGGGAAAVAAGGIPGDDGEIDGCYGKAGELRVVPDGMGCRMTETPLSWNQQGPKGDKGDPGPEGPAGPAGPAGGPPVEVGPPVYSGSHAMLMSFGTVPVVRLSGCHRWQDREEPCRIGINPPDRELAEMLNLALQGTDLFDDLTIVQVGDGEGTALSLDDPVLREIVIDDLKAGSAEAAAITLVIEPGGVTTTDHPKISVDAAPWRRGDFHLESRNANSAVGGLLGIKGLSFKVGEAPGVPRAEVDFYPGSAIGEFFADTSADDWTLYFDDETADRGFLMMEVRPGDTLPYPFGVPGDATPRRRGWADVGAGSVSFHGH